MVQHILQIWGQKAPLNWLCSHTSQVLVRIQTMKTWKRETVVGREVESNYPSQKKNSSRMLACMSHQIDLFSLPTQETIIKQTLEPIPNPNPK